MTSSRLRWLGIAVGFAVALGVARGSLADGRDAEPTPTWKQALDNRFFELSFDVRARLEVADRDDLDTSLAWTLRTRAGLGTKPIHGFSGFAELTNTFAINEDALYDNGVDSPNGKTIVADPTNTELNRLWARYQNDDWGDLDVKAGRQRIILDDARFVTPLATAHKFNGFADLFLDNGGPTGSRTCSPAGRRSSPGSSRAPSSTTTSGATRTPRTWATRSTSS